MTLPKELRKQLGVDGGGVVMASVSGDGIVLHPAVAYPIEIYSDERIAEFDQADKEFSRHLSEPRR
ncbi:MAG: AbrB/MazE/SpoVT family DNA-binding domain-containing protein [Kiritimatiellae bacterium]|nr:AbrB/MazE/SpoVT family DNA-binding domain-containing protein [Kiritimatiellia bacterium]